VIWKTFWCFEGTSKKVERTSSEARQHAGGRTGILTLHYGFNEGAILQAYALSELLRFVFGGDVEVVDQRYPSKVSVYGDPDHSPRTRALAEAIDGWLPLSADRYRRTESAELIRKLGDRYDRLIFGSDVLWSLHYRRKLRGVLGRGIWPRQTNPFFPAFPNVYWPSSTQRCSKVAFAASIGSFDWRDLPSTHARMIREGLESCCAIGVRDERTREFVSQLSESLSERVRLLADPTFARPFREVARLGQKDPELREALAKMGVDFDRPRCLVIAKNGEAASASVEFFARRGWQTVGVTTPNDLCSLSLHDQGFHPLEWARLFECFDVCVTERMHGAVFSMLSNVPFVAIEMNEVVGDGLTKTRSLLRRFDLEDVLLDADEGDPVTLQRTFERVADTPWDWDRLNDRIEETSDQQMAFLNDLV
jgi:hypothetical protein